MFSSAAPYRLSLGNADRRVFGVQVLAGASELQALPYSRSCTHGHVQRPDTYEPQGAIELLVVSDPVQPLTAAYSRTASKRVGESRLRRLGVLATM